MQKWHAIGLFCEDVREEKTGHSLIGIMPDNLRVSSVPGVLPKLGMYFRVHLDPAADAVAISSKVRFPDGTEHVLSTFDQGAVRATQEQSRSKGAPWVGFVMVAVASPLPIPAEGRICAVVTVGDEDIVCGALNVEITPEATASPPPP
jgi:hypothetical protein